MNTLLMTVGLPRSGKSTWALKQGYPIVNPDSIRLAIHGQPFIIESEPLVWVIAKYMVNALFIAGHDIVILDATNTTKARRDEWKSKKWNRKIMVFNTSCNVCVKRAKKTNTTYLIPIINSMNEKKEIVCPTEINEFEQIIYI